MASDVGSVDDRVRHRSRTVSALQRRAQDIRPTAATKAEVELLELDLTAAADELDALARRQRELWKETASMSAMLETIKVGKTERLLETLRRGRARVGRWLDAGSATGSAGRAPRSELDGSPRRRTPTSRHPNHPWPAHPTVSVLVLNLNGLEYLDTCLSSLEAQTFPADDVEIVLVDNGSRDGSVAAVRARYPGVRVVAFESNQGFADAYNAAVATCETEFVAFLNNDTRVDPHWLAELVAAGTRHHAAAVASKIVDWSGEHIDFAGGIVSAVGHSWQRDTGEPATTTYPEDRLLFACGGSMLVDREVFVDAGGFDPSFFAYFEDVDLGWRLALLGHTTIFASLALTYHRLHGTAGRLAMAPRLRLYERNALMMIYKNYAPETLARVLPVAVALACARACAHSPFDAQGFAFGHPIPESLALSASTVAHLIALEDFVCALPVLEEKRRAIQMRRRQADDEDVLSLFREPTRLHDLDPAYERTGRALLETFGVNNCFGVSGASTTTRHGEADARATGSTDVDVAPVTDGEGAAQPQVSVVVLVAAGPVHLPECLTALRAQTYPADHCEVIVVDNGSREDPTPVVNRHYPGARVIRTGANLGFAAGNNVGARAAGGEFVAFLNDDTRVRRDWLAELVAVARRRGVASVASQILSWDGRDVDFAGGSVNFQGGSVPISGLLLACSETWTWKPPWS